MSDIAGKWEATLIQVVKQPLPGVDSALVIAGSDRGTIYGVYDVSGADGVSPWHWFADVPPKQHNNSSFPPGDMCSLRPAVKYRGIFINDEGSP